MADLRNIASQIGLHDVKTYIQSGNLVFVTSEPLDTVGPRLEAALMERFGFPVEVIVRSTDQWDRYAAGSPFPDAERSNPERLQLGLAKGAIPGEAVEVLRARGAAGERVALVDDALWIDYPQGIARSGLSPAVIDRAVGSTVTARNWKTVLGIAGILGEPTVSRE